MQGLPCSRGSSFSNEALPQTSSLRPRHNRLDGLRQGRVGCCSAERSAAPLKHGLLVSPKLTFASWNALGWLRRLEAFLVDKIAAAFRVDARVIALGSDPGNIRHRKRHHPLPRRHQRPVGTGTKIAEQGRDADSPWVSSLVKSCHE